ncbi:MAG: hypothetical protein A3F82_10295 [Deltaproteobacteria bacterium RIFCSPLOWO2_12_FULL_44_12]|nr:MAG: hypothetical protein A2712_07775 [Deltaproteobacteria bacterium RIFCSPHIGHO2_01_FULL_43_49]OGQ14761.1 MAG: hypothetical protein A3D22_09220 [Deltaproteobacteria bacterium RIFCSPHIGHO2_02_FULL_44_53]OGQ28147.1 MAG: hypothetical protein A3D98_07930 [Deltaproteobacteria bacterium RIFCSPHIGHO2_12_FULL_44_21]OGQ31359.1 MAG: hypothetical protein A2979_07980 [Deltaproteobacteria bacterium RIFCSPLOWO2_01_FULL_45_74]OGQ43351.1 MAG: hypothetical protein A3I70_01640 [Deltaproteobacteria bacterium 
MKIATIDIGTHSVLLLIVEQSSNGKIIPLVDEATLTRIGEGMATNYVFLPLGISRTLEVLKKYKKICDEQDVQKIIAVGTAAFRKAANANAFVVKVEKECGFKIEIISGKREAQLTWKAASTDFGTNIVVVDIGGGSTEIIPQENQEVSLPIGSVLLTERYYNSDPISAKDYQNICDAIDEKINKLSPLLISSPSRGEESKERVILIATAGTATTLGAIKKKMKVYKHHEVHGSKITLGEIKTIIADFKSKTIEERKKIPGLEPGRADVILAGSTLLEKIAGHFGFKEITVSDRGVRWGLAYEYLSRL